jgi:hypothetical protein
VTLEEVESGETIVEFLGGSDSAKGRGGCRRDQIEELSSGKVKKGC